MTWSTWIKVDSKGLNFLKEIRSCQLVSCNRIEIVSTLTPSLTIMIIVAIVG